jgi:hypothetical protein
MHYKSPEGSSSSLTVLENDELPEIEQIEDKIETTIQDNINALAHGLTSEHESSISRSCFTLVPYDLDILDVCRDYKMGQFQSGSRPRL